MRRSDLLRSSLGAGLGATIGSSNLLIALGKCLAACKYGRCCCGRANACDEFPPFGIHGHRTLHLLNNPE
jgi:hypothetical protein